MFAQLIGGMLFADGGVGLVSVGLIAGAAEWLLQGRLCLVSNVSLVLEFPVGLSFLWD
ncbi:hypothetical protein SynA1825c_02078 [Synechococcus sp. A18-25c]|uniref:hypothetical protein n=1 Tax=Synechococcus sp. A18-25c TaxID=1866938 RepID=UPI001649138A|nr:hypothetical protein [Synechococcus sp. A18-25c]QNJ20376.1 hypothetical protein SynA1825c_02078 [Synechococcus sp. A18-25c]